MKKFWIQVVFLLIITFAALYVSFNPAILQGQLIPAKSTTFVRQLKIDNNVIDIEIADSPGLRKQGLGGRESLATNSGMLFIFESAKKHQFWMKRMRFPLDLIYIRSGKVVDILKDAQPPQEGQKDETLPIYQPVVPVNMVLEVNSGFASSHGIRVGDNVFLIE